jgi:hypothetical protein
MPYLSSVFVIIFAVTTVVEAVLPLHHPPPSSPRVVHTPGLDSMENADIDMLELAPPASHELRNNTCCPTPGRAIFDHGFKPFNLALFFTVRSLCCWQLYIGEMGIWIPILQFELLTELHMHDCKFRV